MKLGGWVTPRMNVGLVGTITLTATWRKSMKSGNAAGTQQGKTVNESDYCWTGERWQKIPASAFKLAEED